jgi:hypothetical protein
MATIVAGNASLIHLSIVVLPFRRAPQGRRSVAWWGLAPLR